MAKTSNVSPQEQTEDMYRQLGRLVDLSGDAVIIIDLSDRVHFWNRGAERLYGFTQEEAMGSLVFDLVKTEFPMPFPDIIKRLKQDGRWMGEVVQQTKAGEKITVLTRWELDPGSAETEPRILKANTDITEQKKAEALRQVNLYNRSLIEASLDPLVTIAADGTITDVNSATERVTGRTRDELIGTDFSNYFTEPDKAREGYQQVFREGSVRDYPLEIQHSDGSLTPVLYNASVYRDAAGNVAGVFAAARDISVQRQAEVALHEASIYNRSLIDASLDPLVTIAADGTITDVNTATERVTGRTREKLIGTDFSNYFTEPDKAREGYQQVFREGAVRDYPLEIQHSDGSLTPVLYNASVYRDAAGNVLGVFAAARDISVQRQAEVALHEASIYNRSLIDASLDPLVTIAADGTITDVNTATERVTGRTREKLIGTDFSNYFTEPDKAREGYQQVFREGAVRDYPLEIQHSDGSLTPVLYNASVYRDAAGNVAGVFAAARDISVQRQAEAALHGASIYNRSLIEASLDPLVTIAADGTITDVNTATERVTGRTRDELIGTDFSNYFTEPDKAREGYQQVFREGSVRDYPLEIQHSNGSLAPVLYNASVYLDAAGNVAGVFAAARDISDRKRAEEALARQAAQEALAHQAQEILEISTPVLQIWDGVVVAPLIGTLDSQRTQQFMERLLNAIVAANASVAIVDITAVPTIDTQTAQHLIDTFNAVQLLGARIVLTGVRPAIAQAVVHLGIDLTGVCTRPSLMAGLRSVLESTSAQGSDIPSGR
ncbi:MAG: PAS domain S-box protein [Armatimonadota bacterium]